MKTAWGALALAMAVGNGSIALADDGRCPADACPAAPAAPAAPTLQIQDGEGEQDEAAQIKELEVRLNEVLIVEESGRVVLKDEYKNSLPFPPERVQQMLGSFVELGPDGKIRVKNVDMVRPYLPMIRRFLSPESMERLRDIQKLPPEERADAMRRMFGQPQPSPGATPAPAPRSQATPAPQPKVAPRGEEEGWENDGPDDEDRPLHRRGERQPLHRDGPDRGGRRPDRGADDDDRLARLEHRLDKIERMLSESLGRRHESRGPSANSDRGRGLLELFGLRRERKEGARRGGLGDVGRRARVWREGLQKLSEILEPDDFERVAAALERIRLESGDLRDREQLMQKLQEGLDPADMGRFMEIFSEFIATPEGREFAAELERMVERLEGVVNSEQGDRFGDAMERLGQGDLRERLEQLIRGRDRGQRGARGGNSKRDEPKRESGARPRNLPEGAKLY